ncbi:hypothetical protein [Victivallis sp. Marseille-Q1083]|uniref:hypothetical protein n=1 Tax=Victivallis sp. Marseille-Q1083 TaxID=2717288 RepID=UPI00158F593F|nr:hypothetical protein [Victivallis sp. Marseille-Q1083]
MNLRELCMNTMADSEVSSEELRRLLGLYRETGDPNDLTYGIILELELLHREQDRRLQSEVKRNEVMLERINAILQQNHEQTLELATRFQIHYRLQFRRLIAIHRERFANKCVFTVCLLLLALLAGIGAFHLYCWWWT